MESQTRISSGLKYYLFISFLLLHFDLSKMIHNYVFLWIYSLHYCPSNSKDLMKNDTTFNTPLHADNVSFWSACSCLHANKLDIKKIWDTRDFVVSKTFGANYLENCVDLYICISDYCTQSLTRSMLLTVGCHVSCHAHNVELLGSAFREKQALYSVIYRYIMQCKFACQFIHMLDTVSLSQVYERRHGGLMISTLNSGSSGLGFSPAQEHCGTVFLSKPLYSRSAGKFNAEGVPSMD